MKQPTRTTCRRPGCRLPRARYPKPGGGTRLSTSCSRECVVWEARARRAVHEHDGDEANELLRLAALLDARTDPSQAVLEVLLHDSRKAA